MTKSEQTKLIERKDISLTPRFIPLNFSQMMQTAAIVEQSKMKGVTKEEAMTLVMRGQEIGVSPMASLELITLIRNKRGTTSFSYHYSLIMGLIRKNLPDMIIKFKQRDNKGCIIEAKRNDIVDEFEEFSFTEEDAKDAGLLGKDNWRHYAKDMYVSKAILRMGRIKCPDILLGLRDTTETIADWEQIASQTNGKEVVIDVEVKSAWDKLDEKKKKKQEKVKKDIEDATDLFKKAIKKSSKKSQLKLKDDLVIKDPTDEDIEEAQKIVYELEQQEKKSNDISPGETIAKKFDPNKKLSLKKKSKKSSKKTRQKTTPKKTSDKKSSKKDIKIPAFYKEIEEYELVPETNFGFKHKYLPFAIFIQEIEYVLTAEGYSKRTKVYKGTYSAIGELEDVANEKNEVPLNVLLLSLLRGYLEDELTDKILDRYYVRMARQINEIKNACGSFKGFSEEDFWNHIHEETKLERHYFEWLKKFLIANNIMKFDAKDKIPRYVGGEFNSDF